jgi:hypothetical protein
MTADQALASAPALVGSLNQEGILELLELAGQRWTNISGQSKMSDMRGARDKRNEDGGTKQSRSKARVKMRRISEGGCVYIVVRVRQRLH